MDRDKIAKKDGRARRTIDVVEIERKYISPDYELTLYSDSEIGDTGRLDIGVLEPKRKPVPPLPWFSLRWDERATAIDADADDCTAEERNLFRRNAQGYLGHHTVILDIPGRVAEWKLMWKGGCLYHGKIRCPVGREVESTAAIGIRVMAECEHRRKCHVCEEYFVVQDNETRCPDCR